MGCRSLSHRVMLPMAAGYQAGLLQWLFRGELALVAGVDGTVAAQARGLALGAGTLSILAEDPRGIRRVVSAGSVTEAQDGAALGSATLPAGTRRAVAVFRGVDPAGEPVVAVGVLDQVRAAP